MNIISFLLQNKRGYAIQHSELYNSVSRWDLPNLALFHLFLLKFQAFRLFHLRLLFVLLSFCFIKFTLWFSLHLTFCTIVFSHIYCFNILHSRLQFVSSLPLLCSISSCYFSIYLHYTFIFYFSN